MPGLAVLGRLTVLSVAVVSAFLVAVVSTTMWPARASVPQYSSYLMVNNTPLSARHLTVTLTYHATQAGYSCMAGEPPTSSPVDFAMDGSIFTDTPVLGNDCQANAALTLTEAQACQGQTFTAALYDPATASQTAPASFFYQYVQPESGPDPCHPFTVPPPTPSLPIPSARSTPPATSAHDSSAPPPPAPAPASAVTTVDPATTARARTSAARRTAVAAPHTVVASATAPPSYSPSAPAPGPSASPAAYLGHHAPATGFPWWLGGLAGAVVLALGIMLLVRRGRSATGA